MDNELRWKVYIFKHLPPRRKMKVNELNFIDIKEDNKTIIFYPSRSDYDPGMSGYELFSEPRVALRPEWNKVFSFALVISPCLKEIDKIRLQEFPYSTDMEKIKYLLMAYNYKILCITEFDVHFKFMTLLAVGYTPQNALNFIYQPYRAESIENLPDFKFLAEYFHT